MSTTDVTSYKKSFDEISGIVYIPCFKTIIDMVCPAPVDEKEIENLGFILSSKVFLEFAAHHTSKKTTEITTILTHPIVSATRRVCTESYNKHKAIEYLRIKEFIISAFTPPLFKSVVPIQESIFEKAITLTKICPNNLKIFIVSNDENIHDIRKKVQRETGFDFTPKEYPVVNTTQWLSNELENQNEIVMSNLYSCLIALGHLKILEKLKNPE